jgi:PAS domain S-box-containing protein
MSERAFGQTERLRQRLDEVLRRARAQTTPLAADLQALEDLQAYQAGLESQNEQARDRHADWFDAAPVGYLLLDDRQHVREANHRAAALLGLERERLRGTPVTRFLPPEHVASFARHLRQAAQTGTRQSGELPVRRADGTTLHVDFESAAVAQPGGARWRVTRIDATERKRAQEGHAALRRKLAEPQKQEALGMLAGGIAHDFSNLLTTILGYAGLAGMELPGGNAVQVYLHQIEPSARRAAQLCQQLLACAGKGRVLVGPLDLNAVVRDTVDLLGATLSRKAALEVRLEEPLPAVQADPAQMQQVVTSLLLNASEALGEKEGRIVLSTGWLDADRASLGTTRLPPPAPRAATPSSRCATTARA